jgi:hypothetical protein
MYEDEETYLVIDPSVKCDDPKYLAYRPFVAALAFFLPVGIISVYTMELYYSRARLNPQEVSSPDDIPSKLRYLMPRTTWPSLAKAWGPTSDDKQRICKLFLQDILHTEPPGLTCQELKNSFDEAQEEHGIDHAVQLLRAGKRSSDEGVKHLEFLYAGTVISLSTLCELD